MSRFKGYKSGKAKKKKKRIRPIPLRYLTLARVKRAKMEQLVVTAEYLGKIAKDEKRPQEVREAAKTAFAYVYQEVNRRNGKSEQRDGSGR
jgi:hypothetical protein